MAYLSFAEPATDATVNLGVRPAPVTTRERVRFSALEWSVIAIAEGDRLSTLEAPGRIAVALGSFFPERPNPKLADPRLEALRRIAVLTWHHGYRVEDSDVRAFVDAGFALQQYQLLADSIVTARAKHHLSRISQ